MMRYWRLRLRFAGWLYRHGWRDGWRRDAVIRIHASYARAYTTHPEAET